MFNSLPQFNLLTRLDSLIDHRALLIGRLISVHLLPGKLVAGDLSVIGWWLPCDVEGMHFGSHFELSGSKEHWERQQRESMSITLKYPTNFCMLIYVDMHYCIFLYFGRQCYYLHITYFMFLHYLEFDLACGV